MSNWGRGTAYGRAALVRPPTDRRRLYRCYRYLASREPPLGLLYIASHLANTGREVAVFDGERTGWSGLIDQLSEFRPDVVGVTSTTFSFFEAAKLVEAVRQACPDAILLLGGPHASALPVDTLQRIPQLDGAVIGEGEETLLEVANGVKPERIPGLAWRVGNDIAHCSVPRDPEDDLDRYELRWDMLDGFPQFYQPAWQSRGHGLSSTLVVSRGCRYACSFCASAKIHGRRYRAHSPEYVVNEMSKLSADYGIRHFYFHDDHFTSDSGWLQNFCRQVADCDRDLVWSCASRIEPLDKETLDLMRAAGCVQIGVGLESGSEKVLRSLRKGVTPDALRDGMRRIQAAGIGTKGYVIIGTEHETIGDITSTWRLIRSARVEHIQVLYYTPLPGSPAFDRLAVDSDHWPKMNLLNPMPGSSLPRWLLRMIEFGTYGYSYGLRLLRVGRRGRARCPHVSALGTD